MINEEKTNENKKSDTCDKETEVYSRVVGFYRPVKQWNNGKREEFFEREEYVSEKVMEV